MIIKENTQNYKENVWKLRALRQVKGKIDNSQIAATEFIDRV